MNEAKKESTSVSMECHINDGRVGKIVMHEVFSAKDLQPLVGCTITAIHPAEGEEGALIISKDEAGDEVSFLISEDGSWSFHDDKTKYLTPEQFGELAMLAGCSDIDSVHFNTLAPMIEIAIKPIGVHAGDRVLTMLRGFIPNLEVVKSKWEFDGELHPMYLCSDPSYNLMIAVAVLPEGFNGTDGD